jgi:hypothetical protein
LRQELSALRNGLRAQQRMKLANVSPEAYPDPDVRTRSVRVQ